MFVNNHWDSRLPGHPLILGAITSSRLYHALICPFSAPLLTSRCALWNSQLVISKNPCILILSQEDPITGVLGQDLWLLLGTLLTLLPSELGGCFPPAALMLLGVEVGSWTPGPDGCLQTLLPRLILNPFRLEGFLHSTATLFLKIISYIYKHLFG